MLGEYSWLDTSKAQENPRELDFMASFLFERNLAYLFSRFLLPVSSCCKHWICALKIEQAPPWWCFALNLGAQVRDGFVPNCPLLDTFGLGFLQVTRWLPDHLAAHCYGCDSTFWLASRKHHCR